MPQKRTSVGTVGPKHMIAITEMTKGVGAVKGFVTTLLDFDTYI